jgi:hypothetical protein
MLFSIVEPAIRGNLPGPPKERTRYQAMNQGEARIGVGKALRLSGFLGEPLNRAGNIVVKDTVIFLAKCQSREIRRLRVRHNNRPSQFLNINPLIELFLE